MSRSFPFFLPESSNTRIESKTPRSANGSNTASLSTQQDFVPLLLSNPSPIAPQDRNLVETLFENGLIQVVCTTSTLALGVNLPVYLVIIKGTVQWKGGGRGYEEIDNAMLQQMVMETEGGSRIDWKSRKTAV